MQLFYLTKKTIPRTILIFGFLLLFSATDASAGKDTAVLKQAVMCGAIENFKPVNPAVVFSISKGEVYSYSMFDPVKEKTVIYHKWYKRDRLIFTMQLTLSPPKWSTFSRIQIRNQDKGPWRVEIRSKNNTLLKNLRFSMAD